VIPDGIVAMEGNGPLNGTPRPRRKIVLGDRAVAADTVSARLMGFESSRIGHLRMGADFLGNAASERVDQVGETIELQRLHSWWFQPFDTSALTRLH